MRDLEVELEFACCNCGHSISARLKCSGKGLAAGPHTVAAVKVACPNCDKTIQLYFEPSGALHAVERYRSFRETLAPSVN